MNRFIGKTTLGFSFSFLSACLRHLKSELKSFFGYRRFAAQFLRYELGMTIKIIANQLTNSIVKFTALISKMDNFLAKRNHGHANRM